MSPRLPGLPASLTGRLVASTVALVAAGALLLSALTALAMHAYLIDRLDREVSASLDRAQLIAQRGPGLPRGPVGGGAGRGEVPGGLGQGPGTLTAVVGDSVRAGWVVAPSAEREQLADAALERLADVAADGEVRGLDLPGVGSYRVVAEDLGGVTLLSGLPTDDVTGTIASLVGWEILLTTGLTAAAAAVGLLVVRRQLRPLRDVAATAHEVAALPLSSGAIGTTARVPDRLTDERTEVGQVGAALNVLLGHVERALDDRHRSETQVRQFVADASHELRTPLATIQGYAELGRRTGADDPTVLGHALGKVETESVRMAALVEDLLVLARLDAGRPLAQDPVDVTRLVLEAVADARVVAPGHHWSLALPDEPAVADGDEHRLHQAVTNLLTNAHRHTPEGTRVTVGVDRPDAHRVRISVHDTGPGVPAHLADGVFERFARGDSSRTRASGGAGLGLALVQAIATAHGGDASVTSRPGSTTFSVSLPVGG